MVVSGMAPCGRVGGYKRSYETTVTTIDIFTAVRTSNLRQISKFLFDTQEHF
jgi:hypothetical protein